MAAARIPDFEHIRRKVPIRKIARDLGLAISGNMVHCWRLENHQNGDRTPSVGLHVRKNTAKCFVENAVAILGHTTPRERRGAAE
jgi:hypothetical protein